MYIYIYHDISIRRKRKISCPSSDGKIKTKEKYSLNHGEMRD